MTPAEYASMIRNKLQVTEATLTNDHIVALTNEVLSLVEGKINEKDNMGRNLLGVIGFADFVEGQREYPFPSDLLYKIIGVEVKLDADDDWQELMSFDVTHRHRATDETTIVNDFKGSPEYDIYRESLWIYSDTITNTEEDNQGIKLWYLGEFKRLENVTENTVHMETAPTGEEDAQNFKRGIPKPIQYWLVRYVMSEYKKDNDIALIDYEANIWTELDLVIEKLNPIDTKQTVDYIKPNLYDIGNCGYDF